MMGASPPPGTTQTGAVMTDRLTFPLAWLALVALALPAPGGDDERERRAPITPEQLHEHVRVLADDGFRGREAGGPECRLAADYLIAHARRLGLEPAGVDGGWLQPLPVPFARANEGCALEVKQSDATTKYELDKAWSPFAFGARGEVTAAVVFAGYGIEAPDAKWNDYEGLDVKGRIVLVLRRGPPDRTIGRQHLTFQQKVETAQKHGAVGVLVCNPPFGMKDDPLPKLVPGRPVKIPAAFVSTAVAHELGMMIEGGIGGLHFAVDLGAPPARLPSLGAAVRLSCDVQRQATCHNVLARLSGADPKLKDEVVVIGAHYDHVGLGAFGGIGGHVGEIHNGADDNASGTAGVLEIAERFALAETRPRRSLLFIWFTGEEKGLYGSRFYCENPLVPLEKTAAMLNLDMIGRAREGSVFIGGVGTSPAFAGMLEPLCEAEELTVRLGHGGAAPSDNTSFYRKGVPALFFFSGLHEDYHRPGDDAAKIAAEPAARIARVAARAAEQIANADARPPYTEAKGAFLGVRADRRTPESATIEAVVEGSAAEHGGLKAGDVVVEIDGTPIRDCGDLTKALEVTRPGQALEIVVERGEERLTLKIVLGERE